MLINFKDFRNNDDRGLTWHEMLFGYHDLRNWTAVNSECLKQLGSLSQSFRVQNYNAHHASIGAVRNFHPAAPETSALLLIYKTMKSMQLIK